MSKTPRTPNFKAQVILPANGDDKQRWPYIGNVYSNDKGSMTLVLDAGVTLHLADGTVLEASDEPTEDRKPRLKIHMRKPFHKAPEHPAHVTF